MAITPPDNGDARPGFPPTREDLFWVDAMRRVLFDSMAGMHRAATIVTIFAGAGLFGYLGWLVSPWAAAVRGGYALRLIALVPAILWAVAAYFGLLTFLVRRYRFFANSPDSSRLAFRRIARKKAQHLFRAYVFWFAGVVASMAIWFFS
jgi:hypothetical protein